VRAFEIAYDGNLDDLWDRGLPEDQELSGIDLPLEGCCSTIELHPHSPL
jgi:hypothetical protein